jgi:hypothetical protein
MTKKTLTQYKVLTFVSLLQTAGKMKVTPVHAVKAQCSTVKYGQGSSNEAMKATLCMKQVLPDEVENYLADDNIFSLTIADIVWLADSKETELKTRFLRKREAE